MSNSEMGDEKLSSRRGDYQPPGAPRFSTSARATATTFEPPGVAPNPGQNPSTPSSSFPNEQNPSMPTSFQNIGGRLPQLRPTSFESQLNTLKQVIKNLQSQVNDLRANNRLFQGLLNNQAIDSPTPDVAKWEMVKHHMKFFSKTLMLGVDPSRSRMFPREEHMKEEILSVFNVGEGDIYK